MLQKLTKESVSKQLHSLWTQHNILLETQKEGERFSFLPVLLFLLMLAYWLSTYCGPAGRVCNLLTTTHWVIVFLLVSFTDDTKINGVKNTKDTIILQNYVDHWYQRLYWKSCILIEQVKGYIQLTFYLKIRYLGKQWLRKRIVRALRVFTGFTVPRPPRTSLYPVQDPRSVICGHQTLLHQLQSRMNAARLCPEGPRAELQLLHVQGAGVWYLNKYLGNYANNCSQCYKLIKYFKLYRAGTGWNDKNSASQAHFSK